MSSSVKMPISSINSSSLSPVNCKILIFVVSLEKKLKISEIMRLVPSSICEDLTRFFISFLIVLKALSHHFSLLLTFFAISSQDAFPVSLSNPKRNLKTFL